MEANQNTTNAGSGEKSPFAGMGLQPEAQRLFENMLGFYQAVPQMMADAAVRSGENPATLAVVKREKWQDVDDGATIR